MPAPKRLLLIGGGHAQLEVLRSLRTQPLPSVQVTLISAGRYAAYTGMVPGYLAGRYTSEQIRFDLSALARAAGATFRDGLVTRVDAAARTAEVDGERIAFDACSIDVGSAPAGTRVAGVAEHALPLRPLANARVLLERVDALLARDASASCVVVGGGAGGVEVALAVAARGRTREPGRNTTFSVALVSDSDVLLPEYAPAAQRRALAACARAGITVRLGARVHGVRKAAVILADGESLQSDITVWVAGAAPPALIARSSLSRSATGYLEVDDTLRATDGSPIWGAGDCITLRNHAWVPKAGVYAVREGPILARNLRAALTGEGEARHYTPQAGFLSLLSLGDGRAIAHWRGLALEGGWAMTLKHRIDTAFMRRYRAVEI